MAALVEGQQYGLSSTVSTNEHKSVVHVKLTDSALKTIDDLIKCKDVSQKPQIQFHGNNGFIRIPSKSQDAKTFQFTVSPLGDPKGLDCVHQPDTRRGFHLKNVGTMFQKLTVHATADVFDKTRQDVKTAQEEWGKIRTQEIKPSGPNIGKRIRRHIKPDQRNISCTNHTSGRPSHGSELAKRIQDAKRESELRTAAALSQPVTKATPSAIASQPVAKATPSAIKPKTAVVSPFTNSDSSRSHVTSTSYVSSLSPHQGSSVVSSSTSAVRSQAVSSSVSSSGKSQANSALKAMPLRDRIIHLLALNSYKKPEIYVKLNKDGLDDEDKLKFESTLKEVGTVINQSKDARYTLAKHAFNDVRPEWPFYSSRDREIVNKKIQSLSPATSPANQPSPGSPPGIHKRPIDSSSDQQQPLPKKQRIAHNRKENNRPTSMDSYRGDSYTSSKDRQHKKENIDESTEASSTSEYPDYVNKYISISDAAQRAKYKQDFNTEYEEYKTLHQNVEKITKKFAELEVLIRRTKPGTDEYENLKDRIKKEYKNQKGDLKYVEQKKRFDYLHKKLGHIKQLILEYDNTQIMCS